MLWASLDTLFVSVALLVGLQLSLQGHRSSKSGHTVYLPPELAKLENLALFLEHGVGPTSRSQKGHKNVIHILFYRGESTLESPVPVGHWKTIYY